MLWVLSVSPSTCGQDSYLDSGLDGHWFDCQQLQEICLVSRNFRPALPPTQHPSQNVPDLFPGCKATDLKCIRCRSSEYVDLYTYSPIRIHGVDRDNFPCLLYLHPPTNGPETSPRPILLIFVFRFCSSHAVPFFLGGGS